MNRYQTLAISSLISLPFLVSALPLGDTQGKVTAVRVQPQMNGSNSFQVWMTDVQNDRWGCLQTNGGYITVYDTGSGNTSESYMQLFAVALTAQRLGKVLALDSAGTAPCSNVNVGWMVN